MFVSQIGIFQTLVVFPPSAFSWYGFLRWSIIVCPEHVNVSVIFASNKDKVLYWNMHSKCKSNGWLKQWMAKVNGFHVKLIFSRLTFQNKILFGVSLFESSFTPWLMLTGIEKVRLRAKMTGHVGVSVTRQGRQAGKSRRKPVGNKTGYCLYGTKWFWKKSLNAVHIIADLSHEITRGGWHCDQQLVESHHYRFNLCRMNTIIQVD